MPSETSGCLDSASTNSVTSCRRACGARVGVRKQAEQWRALAWVHATPPLQSARARERARPRRTHLQPLAERQLRLGAARFILTSPVQRNYEIGVLHVGAHVRRAGVRPQLGAQQRATRCSTSPSRRQAMGIQRLLLLRMLCRLLLITARPAITERKCCDSYEILNKKTPC